MLRDFAEETTFPLFARFNKTHAQQTPLCSKVVLERFEINYVTKHLTTYIVN